MNESATERLHRDEGSEIVSYVLVHILIIAIVLGLFQLAYILHTRNLAISVAGEAARRGALFGADEAEAVVRAEELADLTFGPTRSASIHTSKEEWDGRSTLVVRIDTTLPLFLSYGPQWLSVTGRALIETE